MKKPFLALNNVTVNLLQIAYIDHDSPSSGTIWMSTGKKLDMLTEEEVAMLIDAVEEEARNLTE